MAGYFAKFFYPSAAIVGFAECFASRRLRGTHFSIYSDAE
jgi:hypothetical protein